jgi:cell shape-determining protein MreC
MTRKNRCFLLCCTVALILLSLSYSQNFALQKKISESLLVYRSGRDNAPIDTQELDIWLSEQDQYGATCKDNSTTSLTKPCSYIVAKVIFRNQNSWNSFLWIDVGDDDNLEGKSKIVAKNSPVLSRDSVVGVVDYVGKRASLVRLITDSSLNPAVRVARNYNDQELLFAVRTILETLSYDDSVIETKEEKNALHFLLTNLQERIQEKKPVQYLAKGILQGAAEPLWRAASSRLQGIGFNYDVQDTHGPARDLRSGLPLDPQNEYPNTSKEPLPLLQINDLLVTSGMDGIFPEGLKVARITTILPLQEGAYCYELQAEPTAKDLLDLQYVTVLPPQKFDAQNLPTRSQQIAQQLDLNRHPL